MLCNMDSVYMTVLGSEENSTDQDRLVEHPLITHARTHVHEQKNKENKFHNESEDRNNHSC